MTDTFLILFLCIYCYSCSGPHKPVSNLPDTRESFPISISDSLNLLFEKESSKGHLPGFAVSIFNPDSILFQKGYGYADIEQKKEMDINTIQAIASISKTLIAVSLMKVIEENILSLDDEINDILPFNIVHPRFQNTAITIKHLATHTSSISDDGNYNKSYVFKEKIDKQLFPDAWSEYLDIYNSNSWMPMGKFLEMVFKEDGEWDTSKNFISEQPGTKYEYSNIGAALLAYCIELRTGVDYKEYTKRHILDPLNMNASGWSKEEVDSENHVTYYNEIYNAVSDYECITYPDGGLYTSVKDLTIYLQEMMKGYEGRGSLLKKSSYKTMMTNHIPELDVPTGLIWDMDNTCCIGHGGNDFGIATMMFFNPENGIGKILFTNVSIEKEEQSDEFYSIFNNMFKYDTEFEQL